jgi:hypothetical protein
LLGVLAVVLLKLVSDLPLVFRVQCKTQRPQQREAAPGVLISAAATTAVATTATAAAAAADNKEHLSGPSTQDWLQDNKNNDQCDTLALQQ